MSVEDQSQVQTTTTSTDPTNVRISPLPPAVSPTNSLPSEELPNSNSPVLATMTPVSVDDFPGAAAEYHHHHHAETAQDETTAMQLGNKQVIYVSSANGTQQTILYDPTQNSAEALGQQISIQETIATSNGPVSVVVQQPSGLNGNGAYQGTGATVLVLQEYVEDVPSGAAIPLK